MSTSFTTAPPLVHHQSRRNAILFKIIDNVHGPHTVDFFSSGKVKIDILFRHETLADQIVGGSQNTIKNDYPPFLLYIRSYTVLI